MGESWIGARLARRAAAVGLLALSTHAASAAIVGTLNFESAPVNAMSSLAGGGDVGFTGSSTLVGAPTFGASDVTPKVLNSAVGSTNFQAANIGKVGNNYYGFSPHISPAAAATSRIDTLTLDPVTFTPGTSNRTVSFNLFITGGTGYETTLDAGNAQDFIKAFATIDGGPFSILDSTALGNGGDIDTATVAANGYAPDGAYHTITFNIPDNATNVVLSFTGAANSSAGAEGYAVDNIIFSQFVVPEPGTLGLAGLAALGYLGRRRRA